MSRLFIFIVMFFVGIIKINAQTTKPTKEELAEYLRHKLLIYTPNYYTTYNDITISSVDCTITLHLSSEYKAVIYLANLNASTINYKNVNAFQDEIIISSLSDRKAMITFKNDGKVFETSATAEIFYDEKNLKLNLNDKERIVKALKALILACGGKETKELF